MTLTSIKRFLTKTLLERIQEKMRGGANWCGVSENMKNLDKLVGGACRVGSFLRMGEILAT